MVIVAWPACRWVHLPRDRSLSSRSLRHHHERPAVIPVLHRISYHPLWYMRVPSLLLLHLLVMRSYLQHCLIVTRRMRGLPKERRANEIDAHIESTRQKKNYQARRQEGERGHRTLTESSRAR